MQTQTSIAPKKKCRVENLVITGRDDLNPELAEQLAVFNHDAREWAESERELQRLTSAMADDAAEVSTDELTSRSGQVRSLRLKNAQEYVALLHRRRSLLKTIVHKEWGRLKKEHVAAKREAIAKAVHRLTDAGFGVADQVAAGLSPATADARLRTMASETPEFRDADRRARGLGDYMMSLRQLVVQHRSRTGDVRTIDAAIALAEEDLAKIIRQQAGL